jgi:hypothetical protein
MASNNRTHPNKSIFSILVIPFIIILLIGSACTPVPQGPAPDIEPTQPEESEDPADPDSPANTAPPDTNVSTPSPTASPLPTLTATPAPYADVTGNTNCRFGPGSVYDLLHTYLAGDQVQLEGKSEDGFFWYTSDLDGIIPDCWLWGKYATPVGDTSLLPVFTPPPTPTPSPDFEITHFHTDVAVGSFHFFFKIENTGSVAWESALLYIYDPVVPQDAGRFSNKFQVNGTLPDPTKDSILPGETGYFHSERLSNPGAYGKQPDVIDIYFVICTEEYLGGFCSTKMWSEKLW